MQNYNLKAKRIVEFTAIENYDYKIVGRFKNYDNGCGCCSGDTIGDELHPEYVALAIEELASNK